MINTTFFFQKKGVTINSDATNSYNISKNEK
ncbi:MAG: hypothetical protein ACI97N_001515, partial [Cognaticolwellia sp.]